MTVNAEASTAAIAKVEASQDFGSAEGRGSQDARNPSLAESEGRRKAHRARQGDRRCAGRCTRREEGYGASARRGKAAKAEPPRRPGQIAVFVSRKDSKLYVRENFKPQFDVPITIAPSDRPLGTHVFTAEADKKDPNLLRWSVVSLPVTARNAARTDEDDRAARRRKVAGGAPAEAKPLPVPNSPAEALDRITIAPEAMARIAEVADHRRLDRGVRSRHQPGRRNRRRHRLHRPAAVDSFLTRFLYANRPPPPDQVRGHASLESAMIP